MNLSEPLQPPGPLPALAGQALPPGSLLEVFEVLQVLGLTSCGVLYLARHTVDGNTVAIKEYMPSSLARRTTAEDVGPIDPSHADAFDRGLQAFLNEALTLSQFEHPHLLQVTSVWVANGTAYRAMPYLNGSTLLAHRAASQSPASQAELQKLFNGLLDALHTLYGAGLAHGQIEPVNIYLTDTGTPVLMDFDAVHQAVLSPSDKPHVDAYADPSQTQSLVTHDLHAVASVLHFALSNDWLPVTPGGAASREPLAEVLLRFKDSASVLGYRPEFLAAIDAALALVPAERPGTITELRALFEAPPAPAETKPPAEADATEDTSADKRPKRPKREPLPSPPPAYPLNSSESVLALLANFDRGPAPAAEDVEPFRVPEVPVLTDEAEPALPPLRDNPFDTLERGDELPQTSVGYNPVGYTHLPYTPMPRVPRSPWRRLFVAAGMVLTVLMVAGVMGWQMLH
ncbi:MAG: hypothetical protein ABW190_12935 [Rhizobacter sp.]